MNWFSVYSSGRLLFTVTFCEIRKFLKLMKSEVHVKVIPLQARYDPEGG